MPTQPISLDTIADLLATALNQAETLRDSLPSPEVGDQAADDQVEIFDALVAAIEEAADNVNNCR